MSDSNSRNRSSSRSFRRKGLIGTGVVLVVMNFVSLAPVELKPVPEREPAQTLNIGVVKGDLPYQDIDEAGNPMGLEGEAFAAAARAAGIEVRYLAGSEDELMGKLQSGELDGLVGISYRSGQSAAFFHYLRPFGASEIVGIVQEKSEAKSLWDLRGRDLLSVKGSEAEALVMDHGLAANLQRELSLEVCFEEVAKGGANSGLVCDRARAELILGGELGAGLRIVPGGPGRVRGAVLASGFKDYARDLEIGMEWVARGGSEGGESLLSAGKPVDQKRAAAKSRALLWIPYVIAALFGMGFVMVLMTNRRISRRAEFLILELEERVRASDRAKRDALLERQVARRNGRTVLG